jgi:uncharacterized membrane protein
MPEAPSRRRWLSWALVASLGLNLALVGLLAGVALHGGPRRLTPPGLWHYARALPEAHREALGRELRARRAQWIGAREALRQNRRAMAAALTAQPFDPAAVAALLAEERRLTATLSEQGAEPLVAEIARMTPEERAAYAAALEEPRRGSRGRRP